MQSIIDKQGVLIAQYRVNNRLEKMEAKRQKRRADRLQLVVDELREKLISMGCNPVDVTVSPPTH